MRDANIDKVVTFWVVVMFIAANVAGLVSGNPLIWCLLNSAAGAGIVPLCCLISKICKTEIHTVPEKETVPDIASQKKVEPIILKAPERKPIPKKIAPEKLQYNPALKEEKPAEEKASTEAPPQEDAPAVPNADKPQEKALAAPAEDTPQEKSKPRSGPFMRVHNGSIMLSRMMADMLSYDRPDLPMYDGFGYSFQFPVMLPPYPDTNIEGVMRFRRKDDTAIILISAEKGHSGKLHSVIITPPDAPKEEVIRWLRDETSWPIIEQKWWELYAAAEED